MLFNIASAFLALAAMANAAPTNCNGAATVINNCEVSGQVAMTFDDGPYSFENDIVRNLKGGKGTFFFNGDNFGCIYDRADELKALWNGGHTMGSHTWSHPDMTKLSPAQMHTELEKVETAFIKILGVRPLYFRPPYGAINDQVINVLKQRGYAKVFLWSDDTEDGNKSGKDVPFAKAVIDRVANDYPSPHMVLNHSPYASTANEVVPYAADKLTQKGYKLVTVDTCMGSKGEWPYVWVGTPGPRDASWKC